MPYATSAPMIRADLELWRPAAPAQAALRDEYLAFLDAGGSAALRRDGGAEHLTASCFVFTPDLSRVLLCFHRKGQFWVQLGGHIEPADESVAAAALREAVEEGGIVDLLPLVPSPVDLDRHPLGGGFSCAVHWDVGYAVVAATGAVPVVSDESEHVAWWPVDALPDTVPPGFADRLAGVVRELRNCGVAPLHAG